MLYLYFTAPSDAASLEQKFELNKAPTIEDFPDLLAKAPDQALAFVRSFDAANPAKAEISLALYERLLAKVPEDARAPLLLRIEELNHALADSQGIAFQTLETQVESLIKSGQFQDAIKTWENASDQFEDEYILAEIRQNIRDCQSLKKRHDLMLRYSREAPRKLQTKTAKDFARKIGPLLRQGRALQFTEAYKDLNRCALRLKKYFRTRDRLHRIQRLQAAKASLELDAEESVRAIKARESLAIEKTKDFGVPYKSGVRLISLQRNRFTIKYKKSGRERTYSFQDKPELTAKILQFASRPNSIADLSDRLCFCLEHQLFEDAASIQNQLKSLSRGRKTYHFDIEKLKRNGDPFRGQTLALKDGLKGSRYDFQSENGARFLEDWSLPSKRSRVAISREMGATLTGAEVVLQSEKFYFQDEASVEFPAPGPASSRCRVELRLDTFGRNVFYVAADFNPKANTYTLSRGEDPLTLSPMTGMLAIRPGVPFKLHVKNGEVSLKHGPRTLSCTARRFTNCRVIIRHCGDAKMKSLKSSWTSLLIAGALQADWHWDINARLRRAIDTQILAIQATLAKRHPFNQQGQISTLSVDDPLSHATLSESLLSHYNRAWALYRNGESDKALREFNLLLQGNGEVAGAHYGRGLILKEKSHFNDALQNFDAALKVDALFPEALAAKANMLARTGRCVAAKDTANLALKLWPDCAAAHRALGRAAFAERHFKKALTALTLAQRLQPKAATLADIRAARHVLSGPPWPVVYEAQSKNFIVRTDTSQKLADESAQRLEEAQSIYKELLGLTPREAGGKQLCLIFESVSDFHEYTKNTSRRYKHNFAGLYSHQYRSLLFYTPGASVDAYYRLREVLYHEGFHAYADTVLNSIPVWLNEGLAQVSEEEVLKRVEENNADLHSRLLSEELKAVKTALASIKRGHAPTIAEIMDMGYGEFHNRNEHAHYAFARLLCQFMLRKEDGNKFKEALHSFFKRLQGGDHESLARQKSFGAMDFEALNAEFIKYIHSLNKN